LYPPSSLVFEEEEEEEEEEEVALAAARVLRVLLSGALLRLLSLLVLFLASFGCESARG
jgi:hypothetical protein